MLLRQTPLSKLRNLGSHRTISPDGCPCVLHARIKCLRLYAICV